MDVKHTAGRWSVPHFAQKDHSCSCGYVLSDLQDGMGAIATVHRQGDPIDTGAEHNEPIGKAIANARLIAAAPCLLEAGQKTDALLGEMQSAVVAYLQPGGDTPDTLISRLIYLLDGPEQREAQGALRAAIARATEAPHD